MSAQRKTKKTTKAKKAQAKKPAATRKAAAAPKPKARKRAAFKVGESGMREVSVTELRRDPHPALKALKNGAIAVTYRGKPVGVLREFVEVRATGRRTINERRKG